MRILSFLSCLSLSLCACGNKEASTAAKPVEQAPPPCAPGIEAAASSPVATVNGKAIPCSELYARDKPVVDAITAKYKEKLLEIHALTLAELVDDTLLQAAADEAKLSVEDFVSSSITAAPPSDEEVRAFYDKAVASGQKLPEFDETKLDIAKFMIEERQRASLSKFRAGLRAEAKIELHLPGATSKAPARELPKEISKEPPQGSPAREFPKEISKEPPQGSPTP